MGKRHRPPARGDAGKQAEALFIEALRSHDDSANAPPGLLRGLADPRIAVALQRMHAEVGRHWTMAALEKEAALSRSVFSERLTKAVGVPPMEYLLGCRLAVAKELLRRGELAIRIVAERVGYGSASTFRTGFSR